MNLENINLLPKEVQNTIKSIIIKHTQEELSNSIVDIITKTINTITLKKELYFTLAEQVSNDHFISDMLPRINLGRRAGHSSAIAKYIKQNPLKRCYVLVNSYHHLEEYKDLLKDCSNYFFDIIGNKNNFNVLANSDIIFIDGISDTSSSHYKKAVSQFPNKIVIVLGN